MSLLLRILRNSTNHHPLQFGRNYSSYSSLNILKKSCKIPFKFNLNRIQILPIITKSLTTKSGATKGGFYGLKTIEKLRINDGIPKSYKMIYRSDFLYYFWIAQATVVLVCIGTIDIVLGELYGLIFKPESEKEEADVFRDKLMQDGKKVKTLEDVARDIDPDNPVLKMATVKPEDIMSEEYTWAEKGLMFTLQLVFLITMIRILRMLPIRMYTKDNGHTIRIHYSPLVPLIKVKREMIAGQLKLNTRKRTVFMPKEIFYVDGSGMKVILFDKFFRTPADLHKLMGIYTDEDNGDEEEMPRAYEKD